MLGQGTISLPTSLLGQGAISLSTSLQPNSGKEPKSGPFTAAPMPSTPNTTLMDVSLIRVQLVSAGQRHQVPHHCAESHSASRLLSALAPFLLSRSLCT